MFETTPELEERFGQVLRDLRLNRGLDQLTVAERANISPTSLRNLEHGKGSSLQTVLRVLRVYDRLDLLEYLNETGPGLSPMEQLRLSRGLPAKRQRAPRRKPNDRSNGPRRH